VIKQRTDISIRYGETDQMGYVHHSNYALFLEEARMDLFRTHGLDISTLEEAGIILPVISMEIRYLMPLHFGDKITMETILNPGNDLKLELKYRIFNQEKRLVARASTALVFVEKNSGKLIPDFQKYLEPLTFKEEQIYE